MCGGSMEIHPCSTVSHVFRTVSPYNWTRSTSDILRHNGARLAEVWFDDYKSLYFEIHGYNVVMFTKKADNK